MKMYFQVKLKQLSELLIYKYAVALLLLVAIVKPVCGQEDEYINDGLIMNKLYHFYKSESDSLSNNSAHILKSQLRTKDVEIMLPKSIKTKSLSPQEFYRKADKNVLILARAYQCEKCPNTHIGCASAFPLTEDGICVSNYHVFELEGEKVENTFIFMVRDRAGNIYTIDSIITASKKDDIAVFKIKTNNTELYPVSLAESCETGQTVRLISHPKQRFYRLSEGIIARKFFDIQKQSYRISVTADYAVGSSGAPIFNEKGEVVAMVSSTTSIQNKGYHQMVEHETIPVSQILKLITAH